ncbi:hypothetical protein MY5147_008002 [Beauveria neobassiana]
MGTRKSPTDIINRAQSNGFKSGLHYEEDKKTGLQNLKASAKSFNGGFKRRTGNSVPAETIAEINSWIGGPLTSEEGSGVTNIERPKYNYKPQDLDRNLKALWSSALPEESTDYCAITRCFFFSILPLLIAR